MRVFYCLEFNFKTSLIASVAHSLAGAFLFLRNSFESVTPHGI